jgi:hypothetical protein
MSSCVRKNWFSFAGQLLSLLASELTLFAWAGASQEDFSNVTHAQWPVKDGPWRLQLRTDAEGCNICAVGGVFEYSGATIEFTNNLNRPIDINTAAGNYGSCTWPSATSTKVPPCLQGIAPGSRATIRLVEPAEPWGYNFKVEPEDATTGWTWFEISTGVGGQYDISFNKGYNVPLTVIAPDRQHVVTSKASPDAYPYRQPGTPEMRQPQLFIVGKVDMGTVRPYNKFVLEPYALRTVGKVKVWLTLLLAYSGFNSFHSSCFPSFCELVLNYLHVSTDSAYYTHLWRQTKTLQVS